MKKIATLIVLVAVFSAFGFNRNLEIGVGAFRGTGASLTAIAEEPSGDFEWIEIRPRYSMMGKFFVRDYEDEYGAYTMAQIIGAVGNLEMVGGLFQYQMAAGAHISRLEGGYEFVDFVAGIRFVADYTFFLERPWVIFDGAMLTEGKLLVAWGELKVYPHRQLGVGFRLDYDGNLDTWGNAPYLDDAWENGINFAITAVWSFGI